VCIYCVLFCGTLLVRGANSRDRTRFDKSRAAQPDRRSHDPSRQTRLVAARNALITRTLRMGSRTAHGHTRITRISTVNLPGARVFIEIHDAMATLRRCYWHDITVYLRVDEFRINNKSINACPYSDCTGTYLVSRHNPIYVY